MSQNFDLGPGYFLCYVEILKNYFFTIIYVLCHKNVTKTQIKKMETYFPRDGCYEIPPKVICVFSKY